MDYGTRYTDLIYFTHGDVAVCWYRFFLIRADPKQVVVQLDNHRGHRGILISDHQTRDTILNRIADRELPGIPFAMLCVALSEKHTHHVVSLRRTSRTTSIVVTHTSESRSRLRAAATSSASQSTLATS
ncbi:hypothetical protein [Burkholderia cepacia]|uniref:hypothetical protein n=1 Tax=Burkholderia cepacia TaxID=292 RepID=UPI002AB7A2F9|nr:hypothetical protein [Burkholderia cepacia]